MKWQICPWNTTCANYPISINEEVCHCICQIWPCLNQWSNQKYFTQMLDDHTTAQLHRLNWLKVKKYTFDNECREWPRVLFSSKCSKNIEWRPLQIHPFTEQHTVLFAGWYHLDSVLFIDEKLTLWTVNPTGNGLPCLWLVSELSLA